MGSWAVCSPEGSGNGLSSEALASSALCRLWGLKPLFRFWKQCQLPKWAVNHPVPANTVLTSRSYELIQGSPGAQAVKNLWQCRRLRIDPWVRKIPGRKEGQPTPAVLTRPSHGQRSLVGYSPWKHREGHNWGLYHIKKVMIFPVVMYGCENWTIKKAECWRIDAFELWCWWRFLRVPWTARRSDQS